MSCAYHPQNQSIASCQSCRRPLCPACDHRIKGSPYCQDCIVAGIETLQRQYQADPQAMGHGAGKSPVLALIFGLFPGLGAVYNGQNVKALLHFTLIVGLWTLADIFHSALELIFSLAGAATYFYSLYDAYTSAQHYRAGEDLKAEDERIKHLLRNNTHLVGAGLIAMGGLSIINYLFPEILDRFWPVLLILAGLYFLRGPHREAPQPGTDKPGYRNPPPSVIASTYERVHHSEGSRYES